MKLPDIPAFTVETIQRMEDMSFFTHAQIFDDLLIIAQKETNCFVLKSTEGLIVIDAIWPRKEVFHAIVNAIEDAGWNPSDIKKLVLTHGHVDHTGCGKWIVNAYHPETYLSKSDDIFWEEEPVKKDRPETWKDYSIDTYIKEGDTITLGDKAIYVYDTPGHTPGCLSYIFNVTENGKEHMAALFGGATPPWGVNAEEGKEQYKKSVEHFQKAAEDKNVDVMLSNHTVYDQGLERIAYSRDRLSYMPNIYVIGEDGVRKFFEVYRRIGER